MSTKTKTANGNEHEFAFGHPAVAYRSDFLMLLEAWFDSRAGLRDVFMRPCFHEIAVAGLGVRLKDRRTSAERVDEWRSQRRARALATSTRTGNAESPLRSLATWRDCASLPYGCSKQSAYGSAKPPRPLYRSGPSRNPDGETASTQRHESLQTAFPPWPRRPVA